MVRQRCAAVGSEGVKDRRELIRIGYRERTLALGSLGREPVKAHAEGLAEELRQSGRKLRACSDNAYLVCGKGVAVEQHAVALGDGAAFPVGPRLTQLGLRAG